MLKKNVIAIIPAKGNSKRISGKNYKKFDGKPIIAYTIEKLKKSGIFDRIIVSTDSKKIALILNKLKPPFNTNVIALEMASAALKDTQHLNRVINEIWDNELLEKYGIMSY